MSKLTDLFWPRLDRPTSQEHLELQVEIDRDLAAVRAATWLPDPELALQEARRLTDLEEDRRRTTEGKATTYILFKGALLPLLTYLESAVWEGKVGTAPKWLSVLLLAVAVLYLIGAVTWAFRAVRVSTFEQSDIPDLLSAWNSRSPDIELVKIILSAVRKIVNR